MSPYSSSRCQNGGDYPFFMFPCRKHGGRPLLFFDVGRDLYRDAVLDAHGRGTFLLMGGDRPVRGFPHPRGDRYLVVNSNRSDAQDLVHGIDVTFDLRRNLIRS